MSAGFDGDCNRFRTRIQGNASVYPKLKDGIRGEPIVTNTFGNLYGEYYRGYFKAVASGDYKFYLASDDCSSLWLNSVAGTSNQTTMVQVASMGCCSGELNYLTY
jgi:hypothetical protein